MQFYFWDQKCSCQMYKHQRAQSSGYVWGMRDSGTSIPPLIANHLRFSEILHGSKGQVFTALGDIYTPHPTLYYHLFNTSGWATDRIPPSGPGECGLEAEVILESTRCACVCGRHVHLSAELCGFYLQSSKQLTCRFHSEGQIQLNLFRRKLLL